jgi:hypothetical protein
LESDASSIAKLGCFYDFGFFFDAGRGTFHRRIREFE